MLTPAFAFWAGGLAVLIWSYFGEGIQTHGWSVALRQPVATLQALPVVFQGALVLGLLVGLVVSAIIAERISVPLLRLLEGYWPANRPRWLRDWLVRRNVDRRRNDSTRFSALYGKRVRKGLTTQEFTELQQLEVSLRPPCAPSGPWPPRWLRSWVRNARRTSLKTMRHRQAELTRRQVKSALTGQETAEIATLEWTLRRFPVAAELTMPTRLGNILRAAEERPSRKYGLDAVAVWPQFWLVLPKDAKDNLIQARTNVDATTRALFWGALFTLWTIWAWWALPIALLACVSIYYGYMLSAAESYGDLLEAAFDMHRWELYRAARWPSPASPDDELLAGQRLSEYLWRGTAPACASFEARE